MPIQINNNNKCDSTNDKNTRMYSIHTYICNIYRNKFQSKAYIETFSSLAHEHIEETYIHLIGLYSQCFTSVV